MDGERHAHGQFDAVATLNALNQAVIVTDVDGTITFWSAGAEVLYGWTAAEAVGRPILEVTPADHVAADAAAIFESLRAGRSWTGDMVLRRRDGTTFLARVTDTPIMDSAGAIVGLIGISEDITKERWAEQALQASEQRLRLALDAGRLGVWTWDLRTGVVEWDHTLGELFGVDEGAYPHTLDDFAAHVHPEDRHQVLQRIRWAIDARTDLSVQHRATWHDGTTRWLEWHGRPLLDDGQVRGLVGVTSDVTERHVAEEERAKLLARERQARAEAEAARGRLTFLAAAAEVLGQTIDLVERLTILARLGVPRIADGCVVHLLDAEGDPQLVALHHDDPRHERALRDIVDRHPARLDAPVGVGAAIREGQASWLPEVTEDTLRASAVDQQHLEELRRLHLTSGVSVPLMGRTGTIGALTFLTVGGRRLTADDVAIAEDLGARTGTIIENAQLLELAEQSESANRYQAALLRTLYDSSIDGMLVVGPAGEVLSYNQRFLDVWGFDVALIAQGDAALLDAAVGKVAQPAAFIAGVQAAYRDRPISVHAEVPLADGRTLDRYGSALRDEGDTYRGFAWSFRDVTSDRRQQAEIAAAGERFANLARTLQRSLLPPRLPSLPGLELAARYHPALDGAEVGGDFYDVFAVGDDWMLVIGDVCGKGPEAAALTGLIRYTIRAVAMNNPEPANVLRELNAVMLHNDGESKDETADAMFATVCCVKLRAERGGTRAEVACGGHPLPLLLRSDGAVEHVGTPGSIMGVLDDVDVTTATTILGPEDCLITYTDGVTEARDVHGEQLDGDALLDAVRPLARRSTPTVVEALKQTALDWQRGVAHDDIAILAVGVGTPGGQDDPGQGQPGTPCCAWRSPL